jgi:putative peptidoglycan lipid II flippase
MNRLFSRANKRISLSSAATLLIATSMLGQMLGFLRVKLINANFSAVGPQSTDTFFAAFKIPDFFFLTLAAGALSVAFIPVLSDHFEKNDRKGAWNITSSLINLLAIIMFIVGLAIFIFAKPLLHNIVAPALTPAQLNNSVMIMRIIAFNPLLFTLGGILMSVQQTRGRFFFYAMAPLVYNLSIIISIFAFRNNIGIVGLGIGALAGAAFQVVIALFGMFGIKFRYRLKIDFKDKDFHVVLKNLPPRSIDQGVDAINSIAETNFARRLGEGNISYYENAYILHTAPILLIGTAISTAAFPRLSERMSQHRPDLFRRDFLKILRAMIWIAMPVVVISFFSRGYLARMIFAKDAPQIALIFGFLTGAILFRTIYTMLSRYFYAQKDTVTPLLISLFAIGLNLYLAYSLSKPTSYGVAGLAFAQSIVAAVEVGIMAIIMLKRDHKLFDRNFVGGISRILSVTGFAVVAAFIMISLLPLNAADKGFITLGSKLALISVVTLLVYVGMSSLFGLEEAQPVIAKAKTIILKPVKVE